MLTSIKNLFEKQYINKTTVKIVVLIAVLFVFAGQFQKFNLNFAVINPIFFAIIIHKIILFLVVFLLFLNYYLEALKWKILVKDTQERTIYQCFKDICLGLVLGLITPFMLGDFVGRGLDFRNKRKSVELNLFNSVTQTYTAILFGFIAIFIWKIYFSQNLNFAFTIFLVLLFLASILGLFFVFKFNLNRTSINFVNKILKIRIELSNAVRLKVLILTFMRNIIFTFQFVLLLKAAEINLNIMILIIGANLIFLAKTVGGGLNIFGDLAIRQLVGLSFFSIFDVSPEKIIVVTLLLWIINIGFPACFGLFFYLSRKTMVS